MPRGVRRRFAGLRGGAQAPLRAGRARRIGRSDSSRPTRRSHPWEDFAETWAHYLHIVDTLETASAFGVKIKPAIDKDGAHSARLDFDPYVVGTIDEIIDAWAPFVVAMNSVNRAMGRPDLYPFVLAPAVVEKLRFIHDLVRSAAVKSAADARGERAAAQALGEAREQAAVRPLRSPGERSASAPCVELRHSPSTTGVPTTDQRSQCEVLTDRARRLVPERAFGGSRAYFFPSALSVMTVV